MTLILSLICAAIGALPIAIARRGALLTGTVFCGFLVISIPVIYVGMPELVGPLWGSISFWVLVLTVLGAVIAMNTDGPSAGISALPPAGLLVAIVATYFGTSSMFRAGDYSALVQPLEQRDWSQDIQPKDPRHMRMGTHENAYYIAKKSIGEAGSVGSQFEMKEDLMTLQMVKGELWFIAPLDFREFTTWTSSVGSPGYIMINAEDPTRPAQYVEIPQGQRMVYTPGAFFSKNLQRHVWDAYPNKEIADLHFEVDDNNKPWWVVSLAEPTIGWDGQKVDGALIIDPVTGAMTFYALDKVPDWVDRVLPSEIVKNNIDFWGKLSGGFLNRAWSKSAVVQAEDPILVYGESGRPTWVTGVTSHNNNDDSLLGVIYTDSHSGKSVDYRVKGGATDESIITAVGNHQDVKFKHLHGVSPQLYNVYGRMASVVPLLNENHAFSGDDGRWLSGRARQDAQDRSLGWCPRPIQR